MTKRRSSPMNIIRIPLFSTKSFVSGSSSNVFRGMRKRKALFPEPKGFTSPPGTWALVFDYMTSISIGIWVCQGSERPT